MQVVEDIMSRNVTTLERNDQLSLAEDLMKTSRIRHLPVLNEHGRLVGILSQRDLFHSALVRALGFGTNAKDKMLRTIAKKKDIPVQIEAFLTTGATNAIPAYSTAGDTPSAVVSIATRYIHTATEMIDLRDADRAADLLRAFCLTVKANQKFKVRV